MPLLYPTQSTLNGVFSIQSSIYKRYSKNEDISPSRQIRKELYPAWSVVDDVKSEAGQLSAEAQKEFEKASKTAQAKAGPMELYSANYYAVCSHDNGSAEPADWRGRHARLEVYWLV